VKIKMRSRSRGFILLGLIVIVVAIGLGGCALFEVLKKTDEIERKRRDMETNCPPDLVMDELLYDVVDPVTQPPITEEVLADGNWVTVQGGTVIATNSAPNKASDDDSGY